MIRPASVAEGLTHSAAMCSRAWRAQWPGFDSAQARPPTKELFVIIPTHMMNREIIPGRKKEGLTVFSINCERCRHVNLAVSSLPSVPWVEANRLPDRRPRLEGAQYRNTQQAAHSYSSPRPPYTSLTHTTHTHQFPSSPWANAKNNERTNYMIK